MRRVLIIAVVLLASPVNAMSRVVLTGDPDVIEVSSEPLHAPRSSRPSDSRQPSNSLFPPPGYPSSEGLVSGWNELMPSHCYGFPVGNDLVMKLHATNGAYLLSRNVAVQTSFMLLCATAKTFMVHSPDGLSWDAMQVNAR